MMAAYINRTISMIGADSQFRSNDLRTENSPLQIFVKAKKKINDIFHEIEDYVGDTVQFTQCKFFFFSLTDFIYDLIKILIFSSAR